MGILLGPGRLRAFISPFTAVLTEGQWKLLSDGVSSALWKSPSRVCGGEVTLLPCSATIFGRV